MAASCGEIIAFLEDHVRPDPHWCARMIEVHQQPYGAVGGAVENGIDRSLNWAAYFCDLGKYQNPVPEGESPVASVVNVSYKRAALESIRSVWQQRFNETAVTAALAARGVKLALSSAVVVYQHRPQVQLRTAVREFFIWGRSYAGTRSTLVGRGRRITYAIFAPALPGILLLRMTARVLKRGRCVAAFLRALPLTAILTVSWSCGELVGYVTARSSNTCAPSAAQGYCGAGIESR
jgi:hypothetical protein